MAIEKMLKVSVVCHKGELKSVVDALADLGTVHIDPVAEGGPLSRKELSTEEQDELRRHNFEISKIEFVTGFLRENSPERPGFVRTIIKDKYTLTLEEFKKAEDAIDLERIYAECSEIERRLLALREAKAEIEREMEELRNWTDLDMDLDDIRPRGVLNILPVRVGASDLETLREELASRAPESAIESVGGHGMWASCLLVYHPDSEEVVQSLLQLYKCKAVALPPGDLTPLERLDELERELAVNERRRSESLEVVATYLRHLPAMEILREYHINERRKIEAGNLLGTTRATGVVRGWVTDGRLAETVEKLAGLSEEVLVEAEEPSGDDDPPVCLRNRRWVRPFEVLTRLYGLPHNREFDPTWLIAVSFTVFFGFCIGDVGYGLLLIAAMVLMKRYLPLGENVKDLFSVMIWGGAAAMVFGVLTGSWFGIEPDRLPALLRSMAVFDSLNDPIPVMGVCMGLGLVHMLSGTAVEFHDKWRSGDRAGALIEQGLTLLLFVGTFLAVVTVTMGLLPRQVVFIVPAAAIAGMLLLLGHKNKSTAGKVFGGLYETYNTLVGWLGDTVSYVRLFALGLATFAVGWVINILAGMMGGIAPVVGILLMLVVLVVGHTFNLAVNLLGAFVHPLRLEFVEFFSKFYEDGGTAFRPLGVESKRVIIKAVDRPGGPGPKESAAHQDLEEVDSGSPPVGAMSRNATVG